MWTFPLSPAFPNLAFLARRGLLPLLLTEVLLPVGNWLPRYPWPLPQPEYLPFFCDLPLWVLASLFDVEKL